MQVKNELIFSEERKVSSIYWLSARLFRLGLSAGFADVLCYSSFLERTFPGSAYFPAFLAAAVSMREIYCVVLLNGVLKSLKTSHASNVLTTIDGMEISDAVCKGSLSIAGANRSIAVVNAGDFGVKSMKGLIGRFRSLWLGGDTWLLSPVSIKPSWFLRIWFEVDNQWVRRSHGWTCYLFLSPPDNCVKINFSGVFCLSWLCSLNHWWTSKKSGYVDSESEELARNMLIKFKDCCI